MDNMELQELTALTAHIFDTSVLLWTYMEKKSFPRRVRNGSENKKINRMKINVKNLNYVALLKRTNCKIVYQQITINYFHINGKLFEQMK